MSFRLNRIVNATYVAWGLTILSATYVPPVLAQSNATGTVYGQASSTATSVVLESVGTGAKRTVTLDNSRRFQLTALPPGRYKAQLLKGDAVESTVEIEVLLGQGVEAVFPSTSSLQTVQVTGSRTVIDVSSTNSTTTFTARELANLPIAQNITSIMLLAPDVVKADPRYAGGASIGGGAPSENSYYINGFPVTNPLSQLGSIELPFGAIQQAQILTGGFGAEFGRSTGGVVNIITKSGTNKWEGGASYSIEPNVLRSKYKDIYYPQTGAPQNATTDGQLYWYHQNDRKTEIQYGAYVGGPLIQDKLFLFVAADQTTDHSSTVGGRNFGQVTSSTLGSNGLVDIRDANQRYLGKLDWNITDQHRLEFTTLGDNYFTDEADYGFSYATLSRTTGPNYAAHYKNQPNLATGVGGTANILKYTGNLTEDLTVTALIGKSSSPHVETYNPNFGNGIPGVVFSTATARAPGVNYGTAQPLSGLNLGAPYSKDTTKSFRFDVEYALGSHTLRAGFDENRLTSENAGDQSAGGSTYSYRFTTTPLRPRTFVNGITYVVADGSTLGNAGYYVRQRTFSDVTNARSDQSAQYVEDRWKVIKDVLVTLGLRNESFKGYNGEGEAYIDSKNFLSPRAGASWDVAGDSSMKLFGNIGRYSIQTPTHVAVRGAGVSTLVDQYFTYTGVDANGNPTGLRPLTPVRSPDGETGQPKDPNSVAAKDLKPSYQDELILGFEKALTPRLTGGAKFTYRRLGATLDDTCDDRPFAKYADDRGIDRTNWSFSCLSINPGQTNRFLIDYSGNKQYTPVTLSAADMGLEKPKRSLLALDFFLEHPFAEGWYGKVTYTYSKNKGNTEGQTKSDNGQTDVSATSTWDFKEIMENTYGYLPNDRTHQIKALGYYQATPQWGVGANLAMSSGRPKNCIGNYGGNSPDGDYGGYGSIFFFCDGTPTPRGTQGRLPWSYSLDLNFVYQPDFVKGLKARIDVFNVFNKQSILAVNEIHELDGDSTSVLPTYGRVLSYSDPRAIKLTVQYDF